MFRNARNVSSALALALLVTQAALGQESPPPQPAPPAREGPLPPAAAREVRIVPLARVEAEKAAAVVSQLFYKKPGEVVVAFDSRTNSVIATAEAATLDRIESFLKDFDQQKQREDTGLATLYMQLGDVARARDVLNSSRMLVRPDTVVTALEDLLVVRGAAQDVESVRELVDRLRASAEAEANRPQVVDIGFYFLATRPREAAAKGGPAGLHPTPESLKSVVAALGEAGFESAGLLGAMTVRTSTDGQKFEVSGSSREIRSIRVAGEVHAGATAGALKLVLATTLATLKPVDVSVGGPSQQQMQEVFELNTTITARADEYMVLASSPSATSDLDSVALVARISSAK
jgi:hypothetical protein